MSKAHLTPTVIVDKNNKTTTVYTKPDQGSTAKTDLPAPSALPSKSNKQQIDEIIGYIAETIEFHTEAQYSDTRDFLESYPRDLITELAEKLDSDNFGYILCSFIYDGEGPNRVREGITFIPHLLTDDYEVAGTLLRSLHKYPQLPEAFSYHDADETLKKQCCALLRVTEILNEEYNTYSTEGLGLNFVPSVAGVPSLTIDSPELVDLVLANPDKADQIAALVIERKVDNVALIAEIINDSNSALAEGKL